MLLSNTLRSVLVAAALGATTAALTAAAMLPGWAQGAQQTSAAAIAIDNFTFTPQTLTVKAGTKVTWTNRDDIPHGIASDNNAFAKSKALDTDDSYAFVFATPGTYKYFCYVHPHMTGTIVVEPSG